MHFELTEEQEILRAKIRELAEKKFKPLAPILDEKCEFPYENLRMLAALGVLGMTIPRRYGGMETDTITYALVLEEVGRACASTCVSMAVHNSVCAYPIVLFGTDEQKSRFLPEMATGQKLGAFALTEPNAGSNAANIETTAIRDGDFYILNGTKQFITNGSVADIVLVVAVTERGKGAKGISQFLVEKGTKGFIYGRKEDKTGLRGSDTSELIFDNCAIPKENLLGTENEGYKQTLTVLAPSRIAVAAMAVGIAQAAFEEAIEYAKRRVQFEQPIGSYQMIQKLIVDMATEIEAARLLCYRAAYLKDRGERIPLQASMAKTYATEVAVRATTNAIQVLGALGCTKKSIVERLFRDARVGTIYEGTNEIQRIVMANSIFE